MRDWTDGRTGNRRPCAHCGELYEATQEHKGYARKYCSRECAGGAIGEQAKAVELHPGGLIGALRRITNAREAA